MTNETRQRILDVINRQNVENMALMVGKITADLLADGFDTDDIEEFVIERVRLMFTNFNELHNITVRSNIRSNR